MALIGRSVLQISIPRGGSHAVARMLGQSPDVAAMIGSQFRAGGTAQFLETATGLARAHPTGLLYVTEHAAFLSPERFDLFSPEDRFLLVIRDPARQYASALVTVASNRTLLASKLSARRGRPVGPDQLATHLDEYAVAALASLPGSASAPESTGTRAPGGSWRRLVDYTRRTHDFQPISGMLSTLFQRQPEPEACGCEREWFDQSLFLVAMRSWAASVRLASLLQAMDARRVAVVDFSVLQARPWLAAELCERLELRYHSRMIRDSTRLEPLTPAAYDPLTLPEVARRALLPSLGDYLTLLRHPGYVGPRSPEQVEQFLRGRDRRPGDGAATMGEDPGGPPAGAERAAFLAGNPVAAWAMACAASGSDAPLTRAVEQAHPALSRFFDTARQLVVGAENPWLPALPARGS